MLIVPGPIKIFLLLYLVLKKKSSVRRNFDLAHELGHLLMHKHIDMDSLDKKELRRVEHEANDFASYFLLPKDEFIKNFQELSKKV